MCIKEQTVHRFIVCQFEKKDRNLLLSFLSLLFYCRCFVNQDALRLRDCSNFKRGSRV
jgi:hypothetical protein